MDEPLAELHAAHVGHDDAGVAVELEPRLHGVEAWMVQAAADAQFALGSSGEIRRKQLEHFDALSVAHEVNPGERAPSELTHNPEAAPNVCADDLHVSLVYRINR